MPFEPLTPLRIFFAIVGGLIMVLCGGCSLLLLLQPGSLTFESLLIILLVGGIPFAVGWIIWWAAIRSGRRRIA